MTAAAWTGDDLSGMLIDMVAETISACILLYDRNDELVYVTSHNRTLLPVPKEVLLPGTRLRDVLVALYEGLSALDDNDGRLPANREDWIADQISSLWKERSEFLARRGDRRIRYQKRRLPTGYGICIIQDVSEQKKREDQWRADIERAQLIEEVFDQLPSPVCVKTSDMRYVGVNQAFCELVGKPAEEILGLTPREIFEEPAARRLEGADEQIIRNGIAIYLPERLSAPGKEMNAAIRKFRIGKPGGYHAVTVIDDVSALLGGTGRAPADEAGGPNLPESGRLDLREIAGRKVLIVAGDSAAAAAAMETLAALGADTAAVGGSRELEIFLSAARDAGVEIDLVLLDSEVSGSCTDLSASYRIPTVVVEHWQFENDLRDRIADIFSRRRLDAFREEEKSIPSSDRLDVLVAEDNPVNKIVFSQILEGLGYRFAIAATGEEAVAMWRDHAPRLVLMDITLPGINGFEASRRIRDLEGGSAITPILGVLPHPFERDREACFASGMNEVILKPISPEMLDAALAPHLQQGIAVNG